MFILLDKPYISQLLIDTINDNNIDALDIGNVLKTGEIKQTDKSKIIESFKNDPLSKIYTSAENAIEWISDNLSFTDLPKKINLFKDKVVFRDLTKDMFPDLFYKKVAYEDIEKLDIADIPKPFIIKPSVGFFSLGVYKVFDDSSWINTKNEIFINIDKIKDLYPDEVLETSSYIIEEEIHGDEFAVDAYFDEKGRPVILGIMQHYFASESDVSDRVYISSKNVIKDNLKRFDKFLLEIGDRVDLKNFPLHVEVRIDKLGKLVPIEVNPMRFGGWCTSAELAHHAFGVNSYKNFIFGKQPDWQSIIDQKGDNIHCLIILDNSTGYKGEDIESFDFDKLTKQFDELLELRINDHETYPIFGFMYVSVRPENTAVIDRVLKSDLKEYITLK